MTIDKLVKLVSPPKEPIDADPRVWGRVQRELGIKLPSDLRAFGEIYGTGGFFRLLDDGRKIEDLWVFNPLSRHFVRIVQTADERQVHPEMLDYVELEQGESERQIRENIYPTEGGDFPFGEHHERQYSFWFHTHRKKTKPDAWPIVVYLGTRHDPSAERREFTEGLFPFLVNWLTGKIRMRAEDSAAPPPARFLPCRDIGSLPYTTTIRFPDREAEKRALAFMLDSAYPLKSGDYLVTHFLLEGLAFRRIPFTVVDGDGLG